MTAAELRAEIARRTADIRMREDALVTDRAQLRRLRAEYYAACRVLVDATPKRTGRPIQATSLIETRPDGSRVTWELERISPTRGFLTVVERIERSTTDGRRKIDIRRHRVRPAHRDYQHTCRLFGVEP